MLDDHAPFLALLCLVAILVIWVKDKMKEPGANNSWLEYYSKLEEEEKAWAKWESCPECVWPENCHPGDCRRTDHSDPEPSTHNSALD